jgi:hypothetical protein
MARRPDLLLLTLLVDRLMVNPQPRRFAIKAAIPRSGGAIQR